MNRWPQVDVAKGIAIAMLALGIATLWLVGNPHFEGFHGVYRAAPPSRFFARLVTSTTPATFFALSGLVIGKRFADLADDARSRWAQHLLSRGLFLVFAELGVTQLFNVSHDGSDYVLIFEVLSAFGWGFVVLALAQRASAKAFVALGLALWVLPEVWVFAGGTLPGDGPGGFATAALFTVADQPPWQVEYPVASWLPFLLIGSALGRRWATSRVPTTKWFAKAALVAAAAFVVLRATTTLGTLGQDAPETLQQFLSPTKYPVSLQYALFGAAGAAATLAVASWLAPRNFAVVRGLEVLGRQPLLAFILVKVLVAATQVAFGFRERFGGLGAAATVAVVIVAILIPTLSGYDRLKRRGRSRWILFRLL